MVKDRGDLFNSQIDVSLFQGKNLTWQISGVGAMVIYGNFFTNIENPVLRVGILCFKKVGEP